MTETPDPADMPAVALKDVAFAYPGVELAFDLAVRRAEIAALMGPSGSGKSTLLALIAGFETPQAGRIEIEGRDVTHVPPAARPVSMVFQENNLFAHLDAAANVGLGISPSLRLGAEDRARVASALEKTGLGGKDRRLPAELSGGERQRVALARVLVRDRPVLLLDEPFAALGPALRAEMLDLIAALAAERRMTVLMASHNPDDAERIADRIVFLENGRVAAIGDTARFLREDAPSAFRRYVGARDRT